jgi:hypothetical protein
LEQSRICVVDAQSWILLVASLVSDPDALISWFSSLDLPPLPRIGLEAGPLPQWLYAGLASPGFSIELFETRHMRDAFKAMPIKINKKDVRGIAPLDATGLVSVGS